MRLLHTQTYDFKEFIGDAVPPYVILSHRWCDSEVSYKEFRKGTKTEGAGYQKVIDACRAVRDREKVEWIWIDACCIDKRSSAELAEAINSMYRWYQKAAVCYVYLADVSGIKDDIMEEFRSSDWFSRGWTLQELLAPKHAVFWSSDWKIIGYKDSLRSEIASITEIGDIYLTRSVLIHTAAVARIMSWVSRRQTTRPEDIAYCMLGLFDINMPLLYGEGAVKAFVRLQLEIMKKFDDDSLFAWCLDSSDRLSQTWVGLLAPSPAGFKWATYRSIRRSDSQHTRNSEPPSLTYRRIQLEREVDVLEERGHSKSPAIYIHWLRCGDWAHSQEGSEARKRVPILLTSFAKGTEDSGFIRVHDKGFGEDLRQWLDAQKTNPAGPMRFAVLQQGI